ncbi:MAG: NAD-dependent epimerase/dehydratase family protein [Thermoplasmatota archaeon]
MEYLITGGNGFIGSNLIPHLLGRDRDATVINLDLKPNPVSEKYMDIGERRGRYTFIEGDVSDLSTYEEYLKVADIVINLATENDKRAFDEKIERFIKTNILGARILADASGRTGTPMIHISTDEVYGSCPFTVHRREETSPMDPTNPYSTTMASGERLVALSRKSSGVPLAILRPCELIGPAQNINHLVPHTIKSIIEAKPPTIWGRKGEKYRDWLHIFDMCSAVETVVGSLVGDQSKTRIGEEEPEVVHPGKTVIHGTSVTTKPSVSGKDHIKLGQRIISGVTVFNVTSEMRYTLSAVVEKILGITGSTLPVRENIEEEHRDLGYNPSSKKLNYHGWNPRYTDIEEILKSTVEWYMDFPEYLKSELSVHLNP